jgi:hypothetical protein
MTTAEGDGPDIPDSMDFDDGFVQAASVRELTAEDRARRARRIAQEAADAEAREHAATREARRARRRRRPHRRLWAALHQPGRLSTLGIIVVVVAGLAWYYSRPGTGEEAGWSQDQIAARSVAASEPRPTPAPAKTMTRLGTRPVEPPLAGEHRFVATQTASDAPVTYDPCRVIHVVVNGRTRPEEASGLLEDAFETIGDVTGLRFQIEGPTDEAYAADRPRFQPERYGDRWAPVLVTWSDSDEIPRLHDAAGFAGSDFVEAQGRLVYVTGTVTLDGPLVAKLLRADDASAASRVDDLLLHELGHLVGLDHVEVETEVMFPENRDELRGLGPGDLRGLYELGGGRCVESL